MSRHLISMLALLACTSLSRAAAQPVTKERVDALVAQLVSPNRAPIHRDGDVEYPPGYDMAAQEKVIDAARELLELGPPAFPHLFDHFGDQRYSLSTGVAAIRNRTVGRVCYDVVENQLQPFGVFAAGAADPRRIPLRPHYPSHFKLDDPKRARVWWKAHKDRSLRELQVEALEWVMAEEAKTPERYSDEEREALRELLKNLEAADEPLKPSVTWRPK